MRRVALGLLVSALLHLGLILPAMAGLFQYQPPLSPPPTITRIVLRQPAPRRAPTPVPSPASYFADAPQRHPRPLRSAPVRVRPEPPAPPIPRHILAAVVPEPPPVPRHILPPPVPQAQPRPTVAAELSAPAPSAYPTRQASHHRALSGQAQGHEGGSAKEAADGDPELAHLLNAPDDIPLPASLRGHGGDCKIVLKCLVHPDGTAIVSVLDGTGMQDLDDSIRRAFSGRHWSPAMSAGKPVPIWMKLTIDAHWHTGDEGIDWKGRIPHDQ